MGKQKFIKKHTLLLMTKIISTIVWLVIKKERKCEIYERGNEKNALSYKLLQYTFHYEQQQLQQLRLSIQEGI